VLNLFSLRPFADRQAVLDLIKTDKDYDPNQEPPDRVQALRIFATSTQQTWLVFSPLRVYCVLDSRERENPVLRWSMPVGDVLDAPIQVKDYSSKSGIIDIGDRKDWLFSKQFFRGRDIGEVVRETAYDIAGQTPHSRGERPT
jgi:hypothetical protein